MHGIGVAENVGADVALDTGFLGNFGESGVGVLAGEGSTSSSEQEKALWTLFQSGTAFVDPFFDPGNGGGGEGKPTSLASLAGDSDGSSVELEFVDSEADGFADAQTGSINELHEGSISESDGLAQVWDIQNCLH